MPQSEATIDLNLRQLPKLSPAAVKPTQNSGN
jgi:hypothetical protein